MKSISEGWESYKKEVLPAGAPPAQHDECEAAFWAGAAVAAGVTPVVGVRMVSEELRGFAESKQLRADCAPKVILT